MKNVMRADRIVLGMLLTGVVCAAVETLACSAPPDPVPPPMDYGDAAALADNEDAAHQAAMDATSYSCPGQVRGLICGFLANAMGYTTWTQYSITCNDPRVTTSCEMYTRDPSANYDPALWAYCCFPNPNQ